MGYEHRWALPPNMDLGRWRKFCSDVRHLLAAMPTHVPADAEYYAGEPISLCSDEYDDRANVNGDYICFNGGDGWGLENFYLERTTGKSPNGRGGWVKTSFRPYDLAVCVTLLALVHHFPDADVDSCGSAFEWKRAVELFEKVVGPVTRDGPWRKSERDPYWLPAKD